MIAACLVPMAVFTLVWGDSWLLDYQRADNWSYVKYFRDWTSPDPVLRGWMAADYKGARVAWILPGYLAYHAFGPLAGSLVLNVTVAISSILMTLLLASRLFGRPAGALATVITSAFAGFYASGIPNFWSYHGVICSVFYMLFLLALAELARRPECRRWAIVAGFTGMLAVVTTTNYLVALPSALIFWLLLRGRPPLREVAVLGVVGAGGGALCIVALSVANVLAGGGPLFFMPLVRATLTFAGGDVGRSPLAAWLPLAWHLVFPFLVAVGGIATLVPRIPSGAWMRAEYRAFLAAFASFLVLWGTHFALHALTGLFLAPHFHYIVLGPAALALAGVMRHLPRRAADARHLPGYAYVLLAVLLAVPQVAIAPTALPVAPSWLGERLAPWHLSAAMVESALVGIAALALIAGGLSWRTLIPAGLCLGLAWSLVNPYRGLATIPPECRVERDNFLLVQDVADWLGRNGWHAEPRSWFPLRDVLQRADGCADIGLSETFRGIEQVGMIWEVTSPLPERIADLSPVIMRNQIEAKRRAFFIVLSQPRLAPTLDRELVEWASSQAVHVRPRPVRRETFTRGPLSLTVQVYGTGQRARRAVPGQSGEE